MPSAQAAILSGGTPLGLPGGGSRGPRPSAVWLYLLVLVPIVTELLEGGELSRMPRTSITEIVMTLLLALSVWIINRQSKRLARAAMTDPLTELGNRRALTQCLERELTRAKRLGHPLSLVFIDLDRFKAINDLRGHHRGDRVLRATAQLLAREQRRDVDSCFRVGGDEFVMICPGADLLAVKEIVRRVRERSRPLFSALAIEGAGLSVGTAERRYDDRGEDLLRRADLEMYRDKAERAEAQGRRLTRRQVATAAGEGDLGGSKICQWPRGQGSGAQ